MDKITMPWQRSNILLEPKLFQKSYYPDIPLQVNGIDLKDPSPVYDADGQLHIFGSVGRDTLGWKIFHAVRLITGEWVEKEPAYLEDIKGGAIAAPGMVYDHGFHMFIQTDCFSLGGSIEHLVSIDGQFFKHKSTPRISTEETLEAGIYDPHPAVIGDKKYIVYSGMPDVGRPESINLLQSISSSWNGPWRALGPILKQSEIITHHNQPYFQDYEWGVEGAQLIELPSKLILLNAVCFLPVGKRGTRQRVFFAVADNILGPYYSMGPILDPLPGWEEGENGHAAGLIENNMFNLFYQARASDNPKDPWRYGLASVHVKELETYCKKFLHEAPIIYL
jgi:hypothetical protein